MERNNFWSPYLAGAGLGLTLLASFVLYGWGLGASSAFSLLAGLGAVNLSPDFGRTLTYFSSYFQSESPLRNWIFFEIGGLLAGAFAGAVLSGNFRLRFDRGSEMSPFARLFTGIAGGILIGFSGRLARGCTSGVALSGGAQLALAGWIFVISMFASGFAAAAVFRRLWR